MVGKYIGEVEYENAGWNGERGGMGGVENRSCESGRRCGAYCIRAVAWRGVPCRAARSTTLGGCPLRTLSSASAEKKGHRGGYGGTMRGHNMLAAEGCGDTLPSRGGALEAAGVRMCEGFEWHDASVLRPSPSPALIVLTQERTKRAVCVAGRRRVGKRRKAGGGACGRAGGVLCYGAVEAQTGARGAARRPGLSTRLGCPSW